MFVLDRTKVRTVALVMTCTAGLQLWPDAIAQERPVTATSEADTKGPQKTKKRKTRQTGHPTGYWGPWRPAFSTLTGTETADAAPEPTQKADPVKLVIARAKKQLGKPYRWGAVGPDSFDCSGFTMYAWQAAGVTLPHNSGAQRAATKPVDLDEMKPGDLIFSSGHVGMYLGDGKMIHSPRTGRTVSIDPIHSNAYGAGRPVR